MSININADAMFANAVALATVSSPALEAVTQNVLKAKEEWSGAPIALLNAILSSYSQEQLERFPIMGDKTSNNPDIVLVKEKAGDKGKEVSFYTVWPDSTPIGASVIQELKELSLAKNKESDQSLIRADIKNMNAHQRDAREKYLKNKRTSIRQAYKNSIKLMHKMQAINGLDHASCSLIPGVAPGTFENLILVRSTDPERATLDWEHYNVSQFLRLDVDAAEEKGGTFAALKETLARDSKKQGGAGESEAKPQLIRKLDTFDARIADMHEFMDKMNDPGQAKAFANWVEHLNKSDDALMSTFAVYETIGRLYKMDALRNKYYVLKEKADEQSQAA